MSCRHLPPGYEQVALFAPGMGAMDLIEDQNGVLRVPVHGMKPEVGVDGCPPWTAPYRAVDGRGH